MKTLTKTLKTTKPPKAVSTKPVWSGPSDEGANGGITFSLLSRFLVCRERFRIYVIEGLRTAEKFESRIEYGNMWHTCEESLAASTNRQVGSQVIAEPLKAYCQSLCKKHPLEQEQVQHWYNVCKEMFPRYVEYWSKHPDVKERTPLLQEQKFDVPYKLPSGRVVRLRGKWDAVDLIGKGKNAGIYIQENKTKSDINVDKVQRQMAMDLQSMMYIVALQEAQKSEICISQNVHEEYEFRSFKEVLQGTIKGVRYNIVKRSAHKSVDSLVKKVEEDERNGRIGEWFARWKVDINQVDIDRFKNRCLDPILEDLCDWYQHVSTAKDPFEPYCHNPNTPGDATAYASSVHWQHPFGIYNVLNEGGSSDLDEYLHTGSAVGLQKVETLFRELQ
jgi:hypothetical protein